MHFKSPREREDFIRRNLGIVWYTARSLVNQYQYLELPEAVGDGMAGLVTAADHYDPALGVSFFTYAKLYIRGEIMRRYKQFNSIPLNPAPGQPRGATTVSLFNATHAASTESENGSAVYRIPVRGSIDDLVIKREFRRMVYQTLDTLNPKEREVIRLLYYEDFTRIEAAELLGVHGQTVHNWHKAALEKLQVAFVELNLIEAASGVESRVVTSREREAEDRSAIIGYLQKHGGSVEDLNGNVLRTLSSVTGIPFKRARGLIRGLQDNGKVKHTSKIGRCGGMYRLELLSDTPDC